MSTLDVIGVAVFLSLGLAVVVGWFWIAQRLSYRDSLWGLTLYACATAVLVLTTLIVAKADDEPSHTIEWDGGRGPATVCWYEEVENPDTVVMAGKAPVPIDGGTSWHTVCSKDGHGIPEGGDR